MSIALLQPHELASLKRLDAEAIIRSHARSAYLGGHTAVARILGRYKLFVDTRDEGFGAHVLLDGFWEMWLTLFCARNLRPGMVAVDVGANFGYYSVMFAEFVGSAGRLLAVEPNPRAADLLRRTLNLNGFSQRATVAEAALGERDDERLRLYVPHTEPKNALVVSPGYHADPRDGTVVEVPSSNLDRLCAGLDRVDFIKIDAEGSEERIFAGMAGVLERHRPMIVMELNVARYQDAPGFLARLTATYGSLYSIGFDGFAKQVTAEDLLASRVGEDWLVVLAPKAPL